MAPASRLTRSTEDYLKTIYKLEQAGGTALTSAIAEELAVAPPSVSGMIKRLAETGLLTHQPYKGVRLTEEGRRAALRMIRRHRILESYLIDRLGYDWDTVHDEAERLEHAVSDILDRMAQALGNPMYDPHGAPIPSATGDVETPDLVALADLALGAEAEIRSVSDRDPDRLRFLADLGLTPGTRFRVTDRQPFDGPVTVQLSEAPASQCIVGHLLARSIGCVERVAPDVS